VSDRGVSRGSLHLAGAKSRDYFEGRHKASRPFSRRMFHRQDFRHLSFHNAVDGVKDNVKHLLGACRASSVIGSRDLVVVDLLTYVKARRFGGEALASSRVYIVRPLLSLSSLSLTTIIIQTCLSLFDSFVLFYLHHSFFCLVLPLLNHHGWQEASCAGAFEGGGTRRSLSSRWVQGAWGLGSS
jgi:hypothetical protein